MPKKITTYNRPSLIKQIQMGLGTLEQAESEYSRLEKEGACNKTLKWVRKAIENRVWAWTSSFK